MEKKPWLHNHNEEIVLRSEGTGMIIWLLPDDVTEELQALPAKVREKRKEGAANRLSHILLLTLGMLKYPEREAVFGGRLDRALSDLADSLSEILEHPPKPQ